MGIVSRLAICGSMAFGTLCMAQVPSEIQVTSGHSIIVSKQVYEPAAYVLLSESPKLAVQLVCELRSESFYNSMASAVTERVENHIVATVTDEEKGELIDIRYRSLQTYPSRSECTKARQELVNLASKGKVRLSLRADKIIEIKTLP